MPVEAGKFFLVKKLFIEREDFMENPPKKFSPCSPANGSFESAYIIKCDEVVKDEQRQCDRVKMYCYIPESKSGSDTSGIHVKGTLHWVNATTAIICTN